jgi:hypothetical protein
MLHKGWKILTGFDCVGAEEKANMVKGLLLAVLVNLAMYFVGEIAKDLGSAENAVEGCE